MHSFNHSFPFHPFTHSHVHECKRSHVHTLDVNGDRKAFCCRFCVAARAARHPMLLNKGRGVQARAGATGAGQSHLRNAAWCGRENNTKRSFRRPGAAQEGSHVRFVMVDGTFEGSVAVTAEQLVRLAAQQRTAGTLAAPVPRGDV